MADQSKKRKLKPALTPKARELQLVDLALDLAEEQLLAGTASSQVQTHFLKLGTERARLERVKLEREVELLKAKTESIESSVRVEELYSEALKAFKRYNGDTCDD